MFRRVVLAVAFVLAWDWANLPPFRDHGVAAQQCQDFFSATGTAAGNVGFNVTAAGKPGLFFYPMLISAGIVANAAVTGAAGPAGAINVAGLNGNLSWLVDNSSLTIGQYKDVINIVIPPFTLRTAATNSNFQLQYNGGAQSTVNVRVNLTGCYAP